MSLRTTSFLVIDTETTGLGPAKDRIVEVAAIIAIGGDLIEPVFHTLVNPGMPIPPEVSAVHGVADWDVAGKPFLEEVWPDLQTYIDKVDCLVAHNAPFDRSFLPNVDRPWLDTYRLAQHLWPDAPNHKNQTLRYWLKLKLDKTNAHSADGDALVTANLLERMILSYLTSGNRDDLLAMIDYAESPVYVPKMTFGKHFGKALIDIPHDYLRWVLANVTDGKVTTDLQYSIERVLKGESVDGQTNQVEQDDRPSGTAV